MKMPTKLQPEKKKSTEDVEKKEDEEVANC